MPFIGRRRDQVVTIQENVLQQLSPVVNACLLQPIEFVDDEIFRDIWQRINQLLPHLHPESALDNGREISAIPMRSVSFCQEPYFIRSGWPVELVPIALEASRRHKSGNLSSESYFHQSAVTL